MVTGLGIDIIETERVAEKINRNRGFKEKVFSSAEITYCESMAQPMQHFAARFAAKEALLKALGTGLAEYLDLKDMEVSHTENGAPGFIFYNGMAQQMDSRNFSNILVSISHIKTAACAVVILEQ